MTKNRPAILSLLLILGLQACLSKTEIKIKSDTDLAQIDSLIKLQPLSLEGKSLNKTADINGSKQELELNMDSAFIASEFKSIFSKKFEEIFTNGSYEKSKHGQTIIYSRKEGENTGPLRFEISNTDQALKIVLEESKDNYLYYTHGNYEFSFDIRTGLLSTYSLKGKQKIIGLDGNSYEISGKVKS